MTMGIAIHSDRWSHDLPTRSGGSESLSGFPFPIIAHYVSDRKKDLLSSDRRSAIHSGKLGDIIYALPTVRAMGFNHLVLNVFSDPKDPLRNFPLSAAQQIAPLLLAQPYIKEVTITQCDTPLETLGHGIGPIQYNLDMFRMVASHRVGKYFPHQCPSFLRFRDENIPSHLIEIFSECVGLRLNSDESWLTVEPSAETLGRVVVSVTHNWRSYPLSYWKALTASIGDLVFVGTRQEYELADLPHAQFLPCSDHLQLARYIAGARLFLGTVSFPYALAEALKVPRGLEICHRMLNVFPIGKHGFILHPHTTKARDQVAAFLEKPTADSYQQTSAELSSHPIDRIRSTLREAKMFWHYPNEKWSYGLRCFLRSLVRRLRWVMSQTRSR